MLTHNWLLTHRIDMPEIQDEGGGSDAEMQRSLEDLRRLNRFLFGIRVTLKKLEGWLRETPKPATVLDMGTGSGQIAQALARWAERKSQRVRIIGLDLMPRHLPMARQWNDAMNTPQVLLLGGDGLSLPLADQSVDYITSSLVLHHFDEPSLHQLFTECRRVARYGIAMSDLWRHPLPFYLYKALAEPIFTRSPITFADSTASFHRAYRPHEMKRIAATHLPNVQLQLHFPSFRWLLTSKWG